MLPSCLISFGLLLNLFALQAANAQMPPPMQTAGGKWVVKDSNNNVLSPNPNDGTYPLSGSVTQTASEKYPGVLAAAGTNPTNVNAYLPNELNPNPNPLYNGGSTVFSGGLSLFAIASNAAQYNGSNVPYLGSPTSPVFFNGTVGMNGSGTLTQTWTWVPAPAPNGTPAPPLNLLVSAPVSADIAPNYSSPSVTSGLTGTASASNGLGDTASVTEGSSYIVQNLPGRHLQQFTGGTATVTISAQASISLTNSVLYGTFVLKPGVPPWGPFYQFTPTNGNACSMGGAGVSANARLDYRAVSISCPDMDSPITTNIISANLANNYYKGPYDTQHGTDRYQHARLPTGNSVDSVVFIQNDPVLGQQFIAGHTYNSGAANFTQPTYTWTVSGDGTPDANTTAYLSRSPTNPYGVANLPANLIFGSTWDSTKTKSSQFKVSVTDTDNAVGSDTYSVTWHAQAENFVVLSYQKDVPKLVGSLQPITVNASIPANLTIPGQEGVIDWGSVQQQSGLPVAVVGASAPLLLPEVAAGPYGWTLIVAQAVAAGASYKLGTASPTHPGTVPIQGNADYNEYLADLQHQVTINTNPSASGDLVRFQPPLLASQALAASGSPAQWSSDPYFKGCTAMWQGGWYTDIKDLQGDAYNVNGYSGHVPGHTEVATHLFKYFLWTCSYVPPPPK